MPLQPTVHVAGSGAPGSVPVRSQATSIGSWEAASEAFRTVSSAPRASKPTACTTPTKKSALATKGNGGGGGGEGRGGGDEDGGGDGGGGSSSTAAAGSSNKRSNKRRPACKSGGQH